MLVGTRKRNEPVEFREDVLLNSFQNTEQKRKLFGGHFTRGKFIH
jgi:hypothetical protein